jgi:hypothetical protein
MRTRPKCLDKAAHCERLAQASSSSANERILLETAKQWRSLARLSAPEAPPDMDAPCSRQRADDPKLAMMLSGIACLFR